LEEKEFCVTVGESGNTVPADVAGEALEMEDSVPGLPHQVQGGNAQPTTSTFRTKPSEIGLIFINSTPHYGETV
jgi:hypothetical protein